MAEENKKGCGCGCEHEECEGHDEDVIMLEDEDGNEVPFHFIASLEHEGKEYVFLQSAEEGLEEDYLEIYEVESIEEDGQEYDNLIPIEDEVYEKLYGIFMKQVEEGEFDDGCDCGECEEEGCDCDCHK